MFASRHGQLVTADVWGQIEAKCRLSGTLLVLWRTLRFMRPTGMPDLSMSLTSPDLLQDCCFHPCVRLTKWSQSKALSFVPPDGKFTLMEYRLAKPTSSTVLPLTVKPTITTGSSGGSFQLVISSTQPLDRPLDKVRIELLLGTHASDVQASLSGGRPAFAHHGKASTSSLQSKTAESQNAVGRWEYLPDRGAVVWQSNRLSSGETAVVLQGTWVSAIKPCPRPAPAVSAGFEAPLTNVSGIQVSALKIASSNSESGAPFKGVRAMMRSKCIDFRW